MPYTVFKAAEPMLADNSLFEKGRVQNSLKDSEEANLLLKSDQLSLPFFLE
jgi:hypothetical protein